MDCLSLIPAALLSLFLSVTEGMPDQARENLCAQIRQESVWVPDAVSFAGASGLAQAMPPTGREWFPQLGCEWPRDRFDPSCSLRFQRAYMTWLLGSGICQGAAPATRWALAFACYNAGLGWIRKERRLCAGPLHPGCDPARWWGNVEETCLRAASSCHETRVYNERIRQYGAAETDS